ncbi:MAG: glycosyltransferase [Patescibacteria group bacterium]
MKIGLLHNLYDEFARGGAETVAEQMAEEALAAGQSVFLITTKPRLSAKPLMTTEKNGLRIYYLASRFSNLGESSRLYRVFWQIGHIFSIRKYRQIKKILQAERPDIVVTHNLMGLGFLAPLALRRLATHHEHFLHDIQLLHPSGLLFWGQEKNIASFNARIYQALTRALFASPTKIISPSRWLLELHREHRFFRDSKIEIRPLEIKPLKSKGTAQPGGQTLLDKQPLAKDSAKDFLFVGQLETHKGIFLLLEAFQKINDPTLKLRIIGDGQQAAEARRQAATDRRIEFLGRLDSRAVQEIMRASDCLIVPSLCYENSPTVIYEAHAVNLPIIAAEIGGIPEIIGPMDRLFAPGDASDLRQKIEVATG